MKNLMIKILSVLLPLLILASGIFFFRSQPEEKPEISESRSSDESNQINEKIQRDNMVGVWVPYMSIDLSGTDRSEKTYREKISRMLDNIAGLGADTVIFQVRPFCDALYPSDFFPASHIISGKQGNPVNYDPLAIALEESHQRKLKFHAWVNPLRVSLKSTPESLSPDHPVIKWMNDSDKDNDRFFFKSGDNTYLNPAYSEVRKLILGGISELVSKYELDGIQIDDYFYPENDLLCDKEDYQQYVSSVNATPLSQLEWRTNNINILVSEIYSKIHAIRKDCVFGISPQCNFSNNQKIGADVQAWCQISAYADYICPQIYVSESHPVLPFEKAVTEWLELCSERDIPLYVGLAAYKVGTDADNGTWLEQKDNLTRQAQIAQQKGADGILFFAYDQISDPGIRPDAVQAAKVFNTKIMQTADSLPDQ